MGNFRREGLAFYVAWNLGGNDVAGVIVLPILFDRPVIAALPLPAHDLPIATGTVAAVALTLN